VPEADIGYRLSCRPIWCHQQISFLAIFKHSASTIWATPSENV
jgi:hypothetical protein